MPVSDVYVSLIGHAIFSSTEMFGITLKIISIFRCITSREIGMPHSYMGGAVFIERLHAWWKHDKPISLAGCWYWVDFVHFVSEISKRTTFSQYFIPSVVHPVLSYINVPLLVEGMENVGSRNQVWMPDTNLELISTCFGRCLTFGLKRTVNMTEMTCGCGGVGHLKRSTTEFQVYVLKHRFLGVMQSGRGEWMTGVHMPVPF